MAPRAWYEEIDMFIMNELGLTCSHEDYNLHYNANSILLLHVDDILLFGPDLEIIKKPQKASV
jgi:hypothetical protein